MFLDPLSDVLSLLKPRSYLSAGLDAGADWAIDFPPPEGIKFNAVIRGTCWLSVDGESKPLRLGQGDCFLLTRGRRFTLASNLSVDAIAAPVIYAEATLIPRAAGDYKSLPGSPACRDPLSS
jgi:Cupin